MRWFLKHLRLRVNARAFLWSRFSMVIVRLNGGLGNQMFQYALGRSVALKYGVPLRFDLQALAVDTKRTFSLPVWRIKGQIASRSDILRMRVRNKLSNKLFAHRPYYRHPVIIERDFTFDPNVLAAPRECWLIGYWQSEKYFCNIAEQIRAEFSPASNLSAESLEIERKIMAMQGRSVFLHIRRGDYAHDPHTTQAHGNCSLEYYQRAASLISEQVTDPCFFVFSDEPEWARENLHLPFCTTVVSHNRPGNACEVGTEHEDLWLMSRCRHAILANSSFSWWGAWLNAEQSRIVVAPKQWFGTLTCDTRDLIPSEWIRL